MTRWSACSTPAADDVSSRCVGICGGWELILHVGQVTASSGSLDAWEAVGPRGASGAGLPVWRTRELRQPVSWGVDFFPAMLAPERAGPGLSPPQQPDGRLIGGAARVPCIEGTVNRAVPREEPPPATRASGSIDARRVSRGRLAGAMRPACRSEHHRGPGPRRSGRVHSIPHQPQVSHFTGVRCAGTDRSHLAIRLPPPLRRADPAHAVFAQVLDAAPAGRRRLGGRVGL